MSHSNGMPSSRGGQGLPSGSAEQTIARVRRLLAEASTFAFGCVAKVATAHSGDIDKLHNDFSEEVQEYVSRGLRAHKSAARLSAEIREALDEFLSKTSAAETCGQAKEKFLAGVEEQWKDISGTSESVKALAGTLLGKTQTRALSQQRKRDWMFVLLSALGVGVFAKAHVHARAEHHRQTAAQKMRARKQAKALRSEVRQLKKMLKSRSEKKPEIFATAATIVGESARDAPLNQLQKDSLGIAKYPIAIIIALAGHHFLQKLTRLDHSHTRGGGQPILPEPDPEPPAASYPLPKQPKPHH